MQIGRVEVGATGDVRGREEHGTINAMGSQQCWTCNGYGQVFRHSPNVKGKGKGKENLGKGKGAYEWGKSNYDGNKGSNYGMHTGGGQANGPSSYGTVKGVPEEGKDPVLESATPAVELISHEIAAKVEEKRDWVLWKPGRLGKSRHW